MLRYIFGTKGAAGWPSQLEVSSAMTGETELLSRQKAYAEIRNLIRSGTLTPQEPLSERHLAERLNIGRMPIREAIQALANDGLVKIIPTRGTFVHQLTLTELRDLYEVRQANEGLACHLAALKGATRDLLKYRAVFERALETTSTAQLIDAQRRGPRFHEVIAEISGNAELSRILVRLRDKLDLNLRITQEHDLARVREAVREHLAILEAIENKDPDEARKRMAAHLSRGYAVRVQILGGFEIRGTP